MLLGNFELCLNVKDLRSSMEFYESLDFRRVGGNPADGWAVLEHANCRLALYEGHIDSNLINFRGGDVFAIGDELKRRNLRMTQDAYREPDGSAGASITDPDGNVIYFNTFPEEQIEFERRVADEAPSRPGSQSEPDLVV